MTAETLTDEMIRAELVSDDPLIARDALCINTDGSPVMLAPQIVEWGRRRVAAAINARNKAGR